MITIAENEGFMANHKSTKKSIRKTVRQNAKNTDRESRIRTFVKNVETAISSGNKEQANAALRLAQPEIMRGVTKNVIKLNAASRKISRLSQRIKALA